MNTFSKNRKIEAFCQSIKRDILTMCDSEQESRAELERDIKLFPKEPDYNLAQGACIPCTYWAIIEKMKEAGYSDSTIKRLSNDRIWEFYLYKVGKVARQVAKG